MQFEAFLKSFEGVVNYNLKLNDGQVLSLQEMTLLELTKSMDLNDTLVYCGSGSSIIRNIAINSPNFWKHTFKHLFGLWSVLQRSDLITGEERCDNAIKIAEGIVYKMILHVRSDIHGGNIITTAYGEPFVGGWQFQIPFEIKGSRLKPGRIFVAKISTDIFDQISNDKPYGHRRNINGDENADYLSEFFTSKEHALSWLSDELINRLKNQSDGEKITKYHSYPGFDVGIAGWGENTEIDSKLKMIDIENNNCQLFLKYYLQIRFASINGVSLYFVGEGAINVGLEFNLEIRNANFI